MKEDLNFQEWLKQADYDFETAKAMFDTGRYIYSIFMCHLTIEKVLKAWYTKQNQEIPPKIHDLIFLIKKIKITISTEFLEFLEELNTLSVPTRYPEHLEKLIRQYTKERTKRILKICGDLFSWLKRNI